MPTRTTVQRFAQAADWRVVLILAVLALTSCDEFQSSTVPIVEPGKAVQPLAEAEYQLFLGADSATPFITGMYLKKADDHYQFSYLALSKVTISPDVFRGLGVADEAQLAKFFSGTEAEVLSTAAGIFDSLPGSRSSESDLSPEQNEIMARFSGFTLGPLEAGYYVHQEPATFSPQLWPATKAKPKPGWRISVAKVEGSSLTLFDSDAACLKASKAIFGTRRQCDSNNKCDDVAVVTNFTDTAELNRQIVLRAVREFPADLKPRWRFVRSK